MLRIRFNDLAAASSHPDIDKMSFTGSTRAGILVAPAAAKTVKRVCQELGGKSANILLPEVDAIRLANETVYGLAAYVQSSDLQHARRVAAEMRAGNVFVNYPAFDTAAPFGGYKQSGNGREDGKWAIDDFTEIKAVIGYDAA
ncbi:MAG TPA: aldehyde dehydrogenase family protein [Rhodopila sp.]